MIRKRVHENPIIKDKVTFLKFADETNGEYTLVEVELMPQGGTPVHYHKSYSETFEALEGILGVTDGGNELMLKPGSSYCINKNVFHRFYNPGPEKIKFRVKLMPGSPGFENSIIISYGLGRDGLINKKGIPKKFSHLALVVDMSDTHLRGLPFKIISGFFKPIARKARAAGLEQALLNRYA